MLITLCIEFTLAFYTLWRYKLTPLSRLIAVSLVSLATFQLAEYFVCTGYGFRAEQWSRLGFVAITTLPPLGVHIMHALAGKPARRIVYAAYGLMLGFIAYFLTYHTVFIGHQCTGNYVIFQIGLVPSMLYGTYYYGLLLTGIILGYVWGSKLQEKTGAQARKQLQGIQGLIIGYLVFLVPTALANTVSPATRRGIPSIMCGFAVFFALIMVLYILPRMGQLRYVKQHKKPR